MKHKLISINSFFSQWVGDMEYLNANIFMQLVV